MFLRRKKRKADGGVDPNGWMMSYADMVTILLAMFIVLSTMSKDQTGVSLHRGTGSYKKAINAFGMPGLFNTNQQAVSFQESSPQYSIDNPDPQATPGTDDGKIRDGEEQQFQNFLADVKKQFPLEKQPSELGRAFVDFHTRPANKAPYLTDRQKELLAPLLGLLRRPDYRLEVIVWAPTPADSACERSAILAHALRLEILNDANLPNDERIRVLALAMPWKFKDVKRPIFSVVVSKTQ